MTRIRQSLIAFLVALLLALPLGTVASADPDDGGTTFSSRSGGGKGGFSTYSTSADPDDGGTSP